jgi:hypothetical protein
MSGSHSELVVGIDASQDRLDAAFGSDEIWYRLNDADGRKELCEKLRKDWPCLVVLRLAEGAERTLAEQLTALGLPLRLTDSPRKPGAGNTVGGEKTDPVALVRDGQKLVKVLDAREPTSRATRKALEERRGILKDLEEALLEKDQISEEDQLTEDKVPLGSMGLAFSGGGIRSATISLGIAQAFMKHKRLLDFDYCSTVSGGGYFGSFLGSLFLPDEKRGPQPAADLKPADSARRKYTLAQQALTSNSNTQWLDYGTETPETPKRMRNPVWWLREHGRYLAPNGSSDYLPGLAYMIRNWLAMLYVFALPVACVALPLIGLSWWLNSVPWLQPFKLGASWYLNPLLVLAPATGIAGALVLGIAYWLTEYMSRDSSRGGSAGKPPEQELQAAIGYMGYGTLGFMAAWLLLSLFGWPTLQNPLALPFVPPLTQWSGLSMFFVIVLLLLSATAAVAHHVLRRTKERKRYAEDALTAEIRRWLTRGSGWCIGLTLAGLAFAAIDTLATHFYHQENGLFAALTALGAWLIGKLPGWFSDGNNRFLRLLGTQIANIALIAGLVLFGLLAICAHMAAQYWLFDGARWLDDSAVAPGWARFLLVGGTLLVLTVITGKSSGFINLSSLHLIYGTRLTRAYLGATNVERLRETEGLEAASIKDSDAQDQIPIDVYQQSRHPGPLHLINVTLNETRNPGKSQLVERDRKGVPLCFAPEGVFIDAGGSKGKFEQYHSWDDLAEKKVESLSVGQLCAISGAAVSSAMGSRTTLGSALALTFANIRLGYWWDVGSLLIDEPRPQNKQSGQFWRHLFRDNLMTYFYLWNEMTAGYSRDYPRLNISDGGHFENSGVYELLRRQVRTILVSDNGADPHHAFEDLELLIRRARLDFGLSINTAKSADVTKLFGRAGAKLFLNGSSQDWRQRVAGKTAPSSEDEAFCLLLDINGYSHGGKGHIVWMKPCLFHGLPHDVVGYAARHAGFPQETTADQFFDEAQWESYRALGYVMAHKLLTQARGKADVLRNLNKASARS